MLLVKTFVSDSPIEGRGLFLAEPVKKGALTWVFDPDVDSSLSESELLLLSEEQQSYIHKYGYLCNKTYRWIVCGDDGRFMNHSEQPSTVGVYWSHLPLQGADIATRDLLAGEELTCNYRSFDSRNFSEF